VWLHATEGYCGRIVHDENVTGEIWEEEKDVVHGFCGLEKAFDRMLRKVIEWALRK
jgi:hypothetical protein